MNGQILGILLIIVIIAFGAFFIQSGQSGSLSFGKISFGVPLNSLSTDPILRYNAGGGSYSGESRNTGQVVTTGGSVSSIPSGTGRGSATVVSSPTNSGPLPPLPTGVSSLRLSSYYGRVKLGTVRAGSPTSQGQVSLRANFSSGEKINVTGWYLKARNGGWYVPKAVNVYDPTGLSEPGDILLGRGEVVNMYTNTSPIGANLRLNTCTGYLNNTNKFSPGLPKQCPGADAATLKNFSSQCQDYVPSAVSSCKFPKSNPPLPYFDEGCREYLQRFNYKGCFGLYRSEPNFLKGEWRVWMGSTFLNSRHDRLFLLDENENVVDWKEW